MSDTKKYMSRHLKPTWSVNITVKYKYPTCALEEQSSNSSRCSLSDESLFSLSLSSLSELKQRYKITAVPKLVIVKQSGDVITDKGRKQIRDRGLACFRSWLEAAEIFQNFKG